MLGGEHALFEGLRRVARKHPHLGLAEHLAGIELFGDDMDRAAGDSVSRLERACVGVEPGIFGQQRWVDVDDPAPPFARRTTATGCA